jgi:hypothetical protein
MGLSLIANLLPLPSGSHVSDDRLATGVNMDVFDRHFLSAAATQVRQRLLANIIFVMTLPGQMRFRRCRGMEKNPNFGSRLPPIRRY